MQNLFCDLLVIGGGINGVGIAADAAGRGLSVILCEREDLAIGTSSASSKLIHGGLRYLEQLDFKLVREALQEREILLKNAPHLVQSLQFILPQTPFSRPQWLIRLGLFLYDHLTRYSSLPSAQSVNLIQSTEQPLKADLKQGFSYFDGQTDDARLVIANAQAAQLKGANILTRTTFVHAARHENKWLIELQDNRTQQKITVTAKALVNAAGPWVDAVSNKIMDVLIENPAQLDQGSHIVVPKLYEGQQAYILQNKDQRVVFVIPWQNAFTLIGTTDVPFAGDAKDARISTQEIAYLCAVVNQYFIRQISPADVVWGYSGVRALYAVKQQESAKISRDYHFELSDENGYAPLLTVLGGKITTYRKLAEQALNKLQAYFPHMSAAWTAQAHLPGGDLAGLTFTEFVHSCQQQYPWLPEDLLQRYAKSYGSYLTRILQTASSLRDLGKAFGAGLYAKEVDYLINHEWAQTLDDVIWRRTKCGLLLTAPQQLELAHYINRQIAIGAMPHTAPQLQHSID